MRGTLRRTGLASTLIALFASAPLIAAPPPRVVGYYAEWKKQYTVEQIPADKLTHINYAFAIIDKDGKCAMRMPEIAKANFPKLVELKKKHPHLRTLVSVGGWADSERFSDAALTDVSRTIFAKSCADFVAEHQLDGVDIDWEFPVSGGDKDHVARPEDKRNFTLLLAELRKQLDARGTADGGKRYLLTIAAPASGLARMEVEQIHPLLDFINLMTYDFAGDWSDTTGFNAALHPVPGHPEQASASASVEAYRKAGVPAEKIVLGVPFYGRGWVGVRDENNGLFQPRERAAAKGQRVGPDEYKEIQADRDGKPGKRFWHEQAKVPWMWNPQTRVFVSYDDPQSLRAKAQYARDNKLGGVMFWELEHDDDQSSLLNALHEGLKP
jgi:chitinase